MKTAKVSEKLQNSLVVYCDDDDVRRIQFLSGVTLVGNKTESGWRLVHTDPRYDMDKIIESIESVEIFGRHAVLARFLSGVIVILGLLAVWKAGFLVELILTASMTLWVLATIFLCGVLARWIKENW